MLCNSERAPEEAIKVTALFFCSSFGCVEILGLQILQLNSVAATAADHKIPQHREARKRSIFRSYGPFRSKGAEVWWFLSPNRRPPRPTGVPISNPARYYYCPPRTPKPAPERCRKSSGNNIPQISVRTNRLLFGPASSSNNGVFFSCRCCWSSFCAPMIHTVSLPLWRSGVGFFQPLFASAGVSFVITF